MSALDQACPQPFDELDDAGRARFLSRLADTDLFAALETEPRDDRVTLRQFALETGSVAVAADSDDRLSGFFDAPVPYAAMPGRVLAAMLAEGGIGLLVNPGAPSQALLSPATLGWLVENLAGALPERPDATQAPKRLTPPSPLAIADLAEPLETRMTTLAGHVREMALVGAEWGDGRRGHLIAVAGVSRADRPAVAKALAEMLAFAPDQPGGVDVAFDVTGLPDAAFVIQAGAACGCGHHHGPGEHHHHPEPPKPRAPGSDPDKPPILRF